MQQLVQVIERYEKGPELLEAAVAGLSQEHLHARPGPGEWSIHEVVIHLADSDAVSVDRMKRIVAMDEPTLLNCDESAFIRRLQPETQLLDDAILIFRLNRRQWARVLRSLAPQAFDRVGHHSISGRVALRDMIVTYIDHLDWHLRFIAQKRERLGVPLLLQNEELP